MGGNKGANKGMHYSHSEKFWISRYERVKQALAGDESALNRFNSAVKDLDSFKVYWKRSGGRWDIIAKVFRSTSTEETAESEYKLSDSEEFMSIRYILGGK